MQTESNKSGSHGVPKVNLFDFMFLLSDQGLSFVILRAQEKLRCFFLKNIYSRNIYCFVLIDSSRVYI